MQALLSFDKAPPFAAPLLFFLTAPLFAVLAGLLLAGVGAEVLDSRWTPAALAATHLVAVGFLLQTMVGALIQVLPVVAGANLERPVTVSRLVQPGLSAGALALAAAFLGGWAQAFVLAALLLGTAAGIFLFAAGRALYSVPSTSPTIRGLKLALAGLAGTVLLGMLMALALGRGWALPLDRLADLHAAWGLGAWSGVLLVAVSYVVVPMFQLTPGYPARLSWYLPPTLAVLCLLWALAVALDAAALIRVAQAGVALAGIGFAAYTQSLQRRRRRARADATFRFWRAGLYSAMAALAMPALAAAWPQLAELPGWAPLFGILLGVGGFMSLVVGMLYKIVPFLSWLHLQNAGQGGVAPNMSKMLSEGRMLWQMRTHFLALGLLAAAVFLPQLARPAGVVLATSSAWLLANLAAAFRNYRSHLAAATAGAAS